MKIVHQDAQVLAVFKPVGQPTIPSRDPASTMPLSQEVAEFLGRPPLVVHRLDLDTSGLVLFALSASAHRFLNLQFEARKVKKSYLAAVLGRWSGQGIVEAPLREFGSGRVAVHPGGKASSTRFRVLADWDQGALVALSPLTGRRHQLRVHLYGQGHPILGDPLYGDSRPVGGYPRLMLHAAGIQLEHPAGGLFELHCAPEQDWYDALQQAHVPDEVIQRSTHYRRFDGDDPA